VKLLDRNSTVVLCEHQNTLGLIETLIWWQF